MTMSAARLAANAGLGRLLLAGLLGGALAAVANMALFLLGRALGVAFLAPVNGPSAPLTALEPINVIVLSLIPGLVAALLLAGLGRLSHDPVRIFRVVAGVVLLISLIPDWAVPMDSLATRIILSLMHVVAAALIVGALLRGRRSA